MDATGVHLDPDWPARAVVLGATTSGKLIERDSPPACATGHEEEED